MTDRELDALVAEKVMGINLKPSEDLARAKVVWGMVLWTGPQWRLKDGREFVIDRSEALPIPEGGDWNDRYTAYIGRILGDEIKQAVDAYRIEARPFSTDISAAWSVVERMAELGWTVTIDKHPIGCGVSVSKSLAMEHGDAMRVSCGLPEVTGVEVPRCICLAALRAVGIDAPTPKSAP